MGEDRRIRFFWVVGGIIQLICSVLGFLEMIRGFVVGGLDGYDGKFEEEDALIVTDWVVLWDTGDF